MNENPYAAPTEYAHHRDHLPEADQIRESHLTAEALGHYLSTIGIPLGILTLSVGHQRLNRTAQNLTDVLNVVGLALLPVGTEISALFLFVFFSKKGRFVITVQHRNIVAKTPHIKQKTSIVT